MMRRSRVISVLALSGTALCGTALAASMEAAEKCSVIPDDRARWACYDEVFGKPVGAVAQPPATAAGAPAGAASEQAAVPVNPQADFGLSDAAKRARAPQAATASAPDSMSATVAKVSRRSTEEMVVTLSDGQVWIQIEPDARARLKVGDTVTIKRAALASYLLVTPSGIATRVKRLK